MTDVKKKAFGFEGIIQLFFSARGVEGVCAAMSAVGCSKFFFISLRRKFEIMLKKIRGETNERKQQRINSTDQRTSLPH
jgi:hypothetical protein